ncbi:hypothetical protein, partial [Salmonella sp. gx-f7]|uniref:hypothetical protein n=1 Tax=Salmonella sp. gx-f7 TaxID=2582606 RepID=UPI001F3449CF
MGNNLKRRLVVVVQEVMLQDPQSLQNLTAGDMFKSLSEVVYCTVGLSYQNSSLEQKQLVSKSHR